VTNFTVVIPTRERADTLLWTLKTCVSQDYENLTILVSDNCSVDNTEEVVRSFKDPRIKYIKTSGRISMSANWDFALEHIKPEGYLCFIGDDDGLTPNSLTHIDRMLAENPVDAITSNAMAIYHWPEHLDTEEKGNLAISLRPTYRVLDTRKFFLKSLEALSCVQLPQLYHGFVKAEIIHQFKKRGGNFFMSSCPDIYSSVVLGNVLSKHIFSEYPLSIHGLSQHSIGSSGSLKHINENLVNQFWQEKPPPFHEKLVVCSSKSIVYADSFMHARNSFPDIPEVDIKRVITSAYRDSAKAKFSETRNTMLEAIRQMGVKNNLIDYVDKVMSVPNDSVPESFELYYGFNPVTEKMRLKTTDFGLKNVYDIFKLCRNLLAPRIYNHLDRPPANEPILNLFVHGMKALHKRIS
jgi:glycosyltransferase involved in cell wall biosynthesis